MKSLVPAAILLAIAAVFFTGDRVAADGAVSVVKFSQNFDSVTAPAIPADWSVSANGTAFVTTNTNSDSAPNSAFCPSPATTSSSAITSPPILVTGATTLLNFRHRYAMETTWDGGVLEISIGGGPFTDIVDAGGTFLTGGYTNDLNPSPNPISGRRAWSGATQNGFNDVSVRLPASTFGQSVRFRWILGTNDSFAVDGWWIDSVVVDTVPTGLNANPIAIPESGNANPYPSAIQIAGLTGFVTGVSVTIENFSHPNPDDVDVLLVAPNGRRVVLMSDTGGSSAANDLDLTFSDSAPSSLPDSGALQTGFFRPTNFDGVDVFPPPAPQTGSPGSALGEFYGMTPNGSWQLFVVDDSGAAAGAIGGGWSLDLKTSINACLFNLLPPAQSFGPAGGNGAFQISIPTGCGWTVSTASSFVTLTSPTAGESAANIGFTVQANSLAARTGLITVTDGVSVKTFQAQQASGCPTSVSQSVINVPATGGSASVAVNASAGCTWSVSSGVTWITSNSGTQSGNGNGSVIVAAHTSRESRSATVFVGAQAITVNQAGVSAAPFDFDGDGRSDISVFRSGVWYLLRSTAGFGAQQFGIAGDRLVPADYDGDGKSDIGVFRSGVWYILRSSDSQVLIVNFGLNSDLPVAADFDGDGRSEIAVFRNGAWYSQNLVTNQVSIVNFGIAGDKPIAADHDGDGIADQTIFRAGTWYIRRSALGFTQVQFGLAGDRPVFGDFNGDGRTDIGVFRDGDWHVLSDLQNYSVTHFGAAGDTPVQADYDGDGKTDRAVFRNGVWYLDRSTDGVSITQFGLGTDLPVAAAQNP